MQTDLKSTQIGKYLTEEKGWQLLFAKVDYVHSIPKGKSNSLDSHVKILHHMFQLTEFRQHGTNSLLRHWDRRFEHVLTSIRKHR